MKESYVVGKLLRAVPERFLSIVSTIEQFGDIDKMSLEEAIGHLKAHEERARGFLDNDDDHLLLTHAEWQEKANNSDGSARGRARGAGRWSGRGQAGHGGQADHGGGHGGHGRSQDGQEGRGGFGGQGGRYGGDFGDSQGGQEGQGGFGGHGGSQGGQEGRGGFGGQGGGFGYGGATRQEDESSTRGGRDKSNVKCFNCGVYGHFQSECRKQRRNHDEEAYLSRAYLSRVYDDVPALMMAVLEETPTVVLLNEEKVVHDLVAAGKAQVDTDVYGHGEKLTQDNTDVSRDVVIEEGKGWECSANRDERPPGLVEITAEGESTAAGTTDGRTSTTDGRTGTTTAAGPIAAVETASPAALEVFGTPEVATMTQVALHGTPGTIEKNKSWVLTEIPRGPEPIVLRLMYMRGRGNEELVGITDSDLAGDGDGRRCTGGTAFYLGDSLVTWISQKQKTVILPSCDAEFMAKTAACQRLWLRSLVSEVIGREPKPVTMKNPESHGRGEHTDTRFHFIREYVRRGRIKVEVVCTNERWVYKLTEALAMMSFIKMRELQESEGSRVSSRLRGRM